MGTAMKPTLYIIIIVLVILCVWGWTCHKNSPTIHTERDTITIRDTVRDTVPRPFIVRFDHWDTLYIPLYNIDTASTDSVPVPIPIERKEYRTDDYRAVISGYRPSLDVMEVFRQTQTVTVTPKPKRWGIGPQVGFGMPGGWYVGIGVSYDIWQW